MTPFLAKAPTTSSNTRRSFIARLVCLVSTRHSDPMAVHWRHQRRVEFSETDMAGIVHFSNFFRYMESAEHAFFRSLGHSVTLKDMDEVMGLPRVQAQCEYRRPLRFEDQFEIQLTIQELRPRSIRYGFRFLQINQPESPEEVATGSMTVVCVQKNEQGAMQAVVLPAVIRQRLEQALG